MLPACDDRGRVMHALGSGRMTYRTSDLQHDAMTERPVIPESKSLADREVRERHRLGKRATEHGGVAERNDLAGHQLEADIVESSLEYDGAAERAPHDRTGSNVVSLRQERDLRRDIENGAPVLRKRRSR